jgi:hypothetical protein
MLGRRLIKQMADKTTVVVELWACISEEFGSNIGADMTIVTDSLRDFSQYLQITTKIVPRLGHDNVLIHPFKFVNHQSFSRSAVYIRRH